MTTKGERKLPQEPGAEFVQEVSPTIMRILRSRRTGPLASDFDDIFQESFLEVWKRRTAVMNASRRSAYVAAIVKCRVADWWRKRHRIRWCGLLESQTGEDVRLRVEPDRKHSSHEAIENLRSQLQSDDLRNILDAIVDLAAQGDLKLSCRSLSQRMGMGKSQMAVRLHEIRDQARAAGE